MTSIRARSKVWLELDGTPLLGEGRERLLRLIDETGSISAAARLLNISYRKAWTQLQAMEELLTYPLVVRKKGGASRGHSSLTQEAHQLLQSYQRLQEGVRQFVDIKFEETFKS